MPISSLHMLMIISSTIIALGIILYLAYKVRTLQFAIDSQNKHLIRYKSLLDNLSDKHFVFALNQDGQLAYISSNVSNVIGYTVEELQDLKQTIVPQEERRKLRLLRRALADSSKLNQSCEITITRKDGTYAHLQIYKTPVYDSNNNIVAIEGLAQDVTEQRENEELLYRLAYYDTLTGLPNRTLFHQQGKQLLERGEANEQRIGLFLIDVDNFKRINDTMGHHVGDVMLTEIASRLQATVNDWISKHSGHDGFVARLGGDEFVIMLSNISPGQATSFIQTIYDNFQVPIDVEGSYLHATISVGIGIFPYDGCEMSTLLKSADLALYTAKEMGRNQFHFHEAGMNMKVEQHVRYENIIRQFITNGDFQLHYQPIVETRTRTICGVEALFRGNEESSDINHLTLITIAEDTGLIVPLGREILNQACEQCVKCSKITGRDLILSVNLSTKQLEDSDVVDMVFDVLSETGLPPERLSLEITETALMRNLHENVRKLNRWKSAGIHISLDDFGKGFSSMSYLKELPVDKIKIDNSFVSSMFDDIKSNEILRAIIRLADTLNIKTCAEGVETKEQLIALGEMGATQVQGFLCGPPMSVKDLQEFIINRR